MGLIAVAALSLSSLGIGTALASAPASPARAKPDLIVSKIKINLLGNPVYMTLGHSGIAPRFTVEITTENDSNVTAGGSITDVKLDDGKKLASHSFLIGTLKPHQAVTKTWAIEPVMPELGFAQVVANADSGDHVGESNEHNNVKRADIAVIARSWDVTTFSTEEIVPTIQDSKTKAEAGFHFKFKELDESSKKFIYEAVGPVNEDVTETGTCTGHGSKTRTETPWASSELWIDVKLNRYHASVESHRAAPFKVTFVCTGISNTTMQHFSDLTTLNGLKTFPAMSPKDTDLSGSHTDKSAFTTTWIWKFKADVK